MPADSFESPLTLAACGGHVELAMLLLERGANIEEVNDEGKNLGRKVHPNAWSLGSPDGLDFFLNLLMNKFDQNSENYNIPLWCSG